MDIESILKKISSIVFDELTDDYQLFLFGSRANNKNDDRSDIDIGIISGSQLTGKQLLTIQEKVNQIPTLLKIDVVDFNSVSDDFKQTALKFRQDIKHAFR